MNERLPDLEVILIESGGDNLSATFSPELADLTIYVIDVLREKKSLVRVAQPSHVLIYLS